MLRVFTLADRKWITTALTVIAALAVVATTVADSGAAEVRGICGHGEAGRGGPCGTTNRVMRHRFKLTVPHSGAAQEGLSHVKTVMCRYRERVVAGGAEVESPMLSVVLSAPNEATTGWSAQLVNLSTVADVTAWLKVYAICAVPEPAGGPRPREG